MECAGPDLDIVGLQDDAPLLSPEVLQIENQRLKAQEQPSKVPDYRGRGQSGLPQPGATAAT